MIASSILEYMFITVTCCEEIEKKLLKRFFTIIEACRRAYFGICICIIPEQIPGISRTLHLDFQDFT